MAKERTQSIPRFVDRIKRHPYAALVTFIVTLVISLATLTDAIENLSRLLGPSPEEAREELGKKNLPYTTDTFVANAQSGDLGVVKLFLIAGMDVNADDQNGFTALMHATDRNDTLMIKLLLDAGADVNYSDTLGWAARELDVKILRQFLDRDVKPDTINRAYVVASSYAKPENLSLLWERVTDKKKVASLSLLEVSRMISESTHHCPDDGLMRIRHQLDAGADPNIQNTEGVTPLLYVMKEKCDGAAQLLLDAGANVNAFCECAG
ncbi:MAG TPA: ankyrin repeat domain-containing protein, partial [Dongiaceae bacterium]|nr:ankyrin repeat domain-containing protein [Dongiaceae bacterium]